jgi:hypothetical protein
MSFTVVCNACGARFALPDDLYQRKFKDRLVTVRCKHCGANISVDGVELASGPRHEIPVAVRESADAPAIEHVPVDMTPTVPLAEASTEWTVSFSHEDDRELDRDQIARALELGEISAETIVWREGMEDWLPIGQVAALADLLPQKADATGGFLGTGMQLDADGGTLKKKRSPPPHPAKRRSSRPPPPVRAPSLGALAQGKTAGKARALSPGTLLVDKKPKPAAPASSDAEPESIEPESIDAQPAPVADKPGKKLPTAPKPPVPAWKANLKKAPKGSDEEPPSSGTPALRDLMTASNPPDAKPGHKDRDVFGLAEDAGSLLAPPAFDLTPPTIDVESPAPPAAAEDAIEVELESEPAPEPGVAQARQRTSNDSARTVAGLLLIGGATAFSVWWFGFRAAGTASTRSTTASAVVETSTPPAASHAAPENTQAAEPTESAEPSATGAPTSTTQPNATAAPTATGPLHAASNPGTPTAERHTSESAHTKAPPSTAPEPSAPTAPTPSTKPEKALGPFNKSAAIAALNSAAAAASACRKDGDPSGMAHVVITFAPSGRVTTAQVNGPPFAGTPTGGCIAGRMRGARVPAFNGDFVTVSKTVIIH